MVKLYHRRNEIAIDLSGIVQPKAIDIIYSGRMQGESMLPDDWIFSANDKRILCLSLSADGTIPELLMEILFSILYHQSFIITGLKNIKLMQVIL